MNDYWYNLVTGEVVNGKPETMDAWMRIEEMAFELEDYRRKLKGHTYIINEVTGVHHEDDLHYIDKLEKLLKQYISGKCANYATLFEKVLKERNE